MVKCRMWDARLEDAVAVHVVLFHVPGHRQQAHHHGRESDGLRGAHNKGRRWKSQNRALGSRWPAGGGRRGEKWATGALRPGHRQQAHHHGG